MENQKLRDIQQVRRDLNAAIAAKYGSQLEPGESLLIEVERNKDVVTAKVMLEDAEEKQRFEMEAAWLLMDQEESSDPEKRSEIADLDEVLDDVVDYVDLHLEEYFQYERYIHFNDDWRKDEYFGRVLRYRSALFKLYLDRLADAWIAANGDPEKVGESSKEVEEE